jgi:5-formyltetrahydrofolate cyclo-ligase
MLFVPLCPVLGRCGAQDCQEAAETGDQCLDLLFRQSPTILAAPQTTQGAQLGAQGLAFDLHLSGPFGDHGRVGAGFQGGAVPGELAVGLGDLPLQQDGTGVVAGLDLVRGGQAARELLRREGVPQPGVGRGQDVVFTHVDGGRVGQRVGLGVLGRVATAVPPDVHGHIPDFDGAQAAADRLAELPAWKDARVIQAVPDRAQLPVRARALAEGKLLSMTVPQLADAHPFRLIDPEQLTVAPEEAAAHRAAMQIGRPVDLDQMQPVDLAVCGSVAVDRHGVRLGKGAGYSDLEFALLTEAGLLSASTIIVTTVHALQVVDQDLPETDYDFSVDLILTPDEVIPCRPPRRPTGLYWADLAPEKIAAIPVLKRLREAARP